MYLKDNLTEKRCKYNLAGFDKMLTFVNNCQYKKSLKTQTFSNDFSFFPLEVGSTLW